LTELNPPPKIRLLVLDLDGTIVDHNDHVRESVVRAAQLIQRRGVAVAIATGRLFQTSLPAYRLIGSTLPLICYEGALIKEPLTGVVHRHWPMDPEVVTQLIMCAEGLSVHVHVQGKLYVSKLDHSTRTFYEDFDVELNVASDIKRLPTEAVTKVTILSRDQQILDRITTRFNRSQIRLQTNRYKSLSVLQGSNPMASKHAAVKYLTEEVMDLRPDEVMTIGDDFTDRDLFHYAGIGVAMGNASDEVKASANWITTNIEEDGMALAVDRWLSLCPV
jgi:Cof subfamily protein (haloacid dehalogenase superfamily)